MRNPLDLAFDNLRNAVKNINVYRSPYAHAPIGKMQDALGTITIKKDGNANIQTEAYQFQTAIIPDGVKYCEITDLPLSYTYVNLRNDQKCTVKRNDDCAGFLYTHKTGTSEQLVGVVRAPVTLILPYKITASVRFYFLATDNFPFYRGLYLNHTGANVIGHEGWICDTSHIDAAPSGRMATVDFDDGYNMTPMYLNRLYLSAKTFENLANKRGTVTNGKLYLGSKNIANMSTAQKNAIIAKGWTIY